MDIVKRFGANAEVVGDTLSIQLSDLTTVGLDSATPTADQIFAALVLLNLTNQPSNAADDSTIGVTVGQGLNPS